MQPILISCLILLILLVYSTESKVDSNSNNKPIPRKAIDIIKLRGFLAEVYIVGSLGYPLTLYRIINPLADQKKLNKYPVLHGHGLLYNAVNMISRSKHSKPRVPTLGAPTIEYGNPNDGSDDFSLPFMFSNNNFDVWLYEAKGTKGANTNLSAKVDRVKAHKYWDFSLDDEALIDLPLMIDFVLTKTSSDKLVYVGYSQSTLFMYALLAAEPQYADKLAAFIALAPVAYVAHIKGLTLPIFAPIASLIPDFVHYSVIPKPLMDTVDESIRTVCQAQGIGKLLCKPAIESIGGKGVNEVEPEFFSKLYHITSIKVIKHFIQLYLGNRFGMYDYGHIENVKRYSQDKPPAYDLSKIISDRIILCRGFSDFLSTPEDQARLIHEMGRKPFMDIVIPHYNHFDFIDGKNLIKEVNAPVMIGVFELLHKDGPNILKNQTKFVDGTSSNHLKL